jgi:tetratricopeptide (TPR) repeat protein
MEEPRMKIRSGLVLAMAVLFGATGCASSGGGGGPVNVGGSGGALLQGEEPRNTENTRAAESAIEAGDEAEDEAEARTHYQQAYQSAQAAITEDPTNPLAHRLAALAALGLEDYQAAGEHFDRASELRPLYEFDDQPLRERTWIDLYQSAADQVNSGNYEAAAEIFEDANAIYDQRPEAMVTLGQIYGQLGQHDRALENLDAAVALVNSEDVLAEVDSATQEDWRNQVADVPDLRARILADAGRFEEATTAFRGLVADHPDNMEYRQALATLLMQMGNEAEALGVYEDLFTREGLTPQDYYQIGVGFYQASVYDQAARAFSEAAEASPRDRDALELWARSMQLDSAFAQVPEVAQRWLELDPYSRNGYLILAQSANANGDTETTQEAIRGVEALEVVVDQLQMQKFSSGGGVVSGSLINQTLAQGDDVTLRFTFYSTSGDPIGSVTETISVGAPEMAEVFQVEFDSGEQVGGYGYELTIG